MPIYRGVRAELRRAHRDEEWTWCGVVIDDRWLAVSPDIEPPPVRLAQAGLVRVIDLPPYLARDDAEAVAVAKQEGVRLGLRASDAATPRHTLRGPKPYRMTPALR
jgi:hypothetical protein